MMGSLDVEAWRIPKMYSSTATDGERRSGNNDNFSGVARPVSYSSNSASIDRPQELYQLLRQLSATVAADPCAGQTDAAMVRAKETIVEWLTYLPTPCVRAMIDDGWHWST
jgi:hypothetical protein